MEMLKYFMARKLYILYIKHSGTDVLDYGKYDGMEVLMVNMMIWN